MATERLQGPGTRTFPDTQTGRLRLRYANIETRLAQAINAGEIEAYSVEPEDRPKTWRVEFRDVPAFSYTTKGIEKFLDGLEAKRG